MDKKILVVLKNPPVSFMVDGIVGRKFLKGVKNLGCFQEGLALYIPYSGDSNIAYIQEMTDDDVEEMQERIAETNKKRKEMRAKLIKPKFKFPPGKSN